MRMHQPDKFSNSIFLRLDPIFALFFEQLFYALCFASTFTMINYFWSLLKFQMFMQVWIIGRNSDWRFYSFNPFHRFVFLRFDSFNRSSDFGFHYTFSVSSFIQTPELDKKIVWIFQITSFKFHNFSAFSFSLSFISQRFSFSHCLSFSLSLSLFFQHKLSFKFYLRQHFSVFFILKLFFQLRALLWELRTFYVWELGTY